MGVTSEQLVKWQEGWLDKNFWQGISAVMDVLAQTSDFKAY
jgi:hypothetical protein